MVRKITQAVLMGFFMLVAINLFAYDLTGTWHGNDGGKYYIRQLGNEIWWYGENSPTGTSWSNVAYGNISGNNIRLKWSDVPKGRIMNSGMLSLEVMSTSRIVAREKTGGFGGSEWQKEGVIAEPSTPPQDRGPQTGQAAKVVFDNGNISAVYNNPSRPTVFTINQPHYITKIVNYHWNNARGATPGTIALKDSYGRTYGPWQAQGSPGQGGVPNAYWTVYPNVVIPQGTYTVIDSEPHTWAQNSGSQSSGMSRVEGYPAGGQRQTQQQTTDIPFSREELTRMTWQFGRGDGSIIAQRIRLLPDGRIEGYYHPNESRWGIEGNTIVFYHSSGRPATRLNSFRQEGGRWVISGPFLLSNNITHVLREVR